MALSTTLWVYLNNVDGGSTQNSLQSLANNNQLFDLLFELFEFVKKIIIVILESSNRTCNFFCLV